MIVSVSNKNCSSEDYLAFYQRLYTQSPTSLFSSIKAGLKAGMRYSTPEAVLKHYFNGIASYEQEQHDKKQYLEITMKSEMFTTLHCKMEEPVSRAYKEGQLMALKSLSPSQYKRSTFLTPKPDMDYVCDILNKEAKERFKSILFWTNGKKREAYVSDRVQEYLNNEIKKWEEDKASFERDEDQKEREYNENAQRVYESLKKELEDYLSASEEVILDKAKDIVYNLSLPFKITASIKADDSADSLVFSIHYPSEKMIPHSKARILASGSLSVKDKTQKEINLDYITAICGVAFLLASKAFNVSGAINNVSIMGYSTRINDKTANINDDCLFAVLFDRDTFMKLYSMDSFKPHEVLALFPHRLSLTAQYACKPINPDLLEYPC